MSDHTAGVHITWPANIGCCSPWNPEGCVCPPMEKALRNWAAGKPMPKMTTEQRECCLAEIDKVEGHSRAEHEGDSAADLAEAVLAAWADYCRDKGLL